METLSRARPKELAHDYLERDEKVDSPLVADLVAQQWDKERNAPPASKPSVAGTNDLDGRQQAAAERWLKAKREPARSNEPTPDHDHTPHLEKDRVPERRRHGPEGDLEL
jgi:hypothetical protein